MFFWFHTSGWVAVCSGSRLDEGSAKVTGNVALYSWGSGSATLEVFAIGESRAFLL